MCFQDVLFCPGLVVTRYCLTIVLEVKVSGRLQDCRMFFVMGEQELASCKNILLQPILTAVDYCNGQLAQGLVGGTYLP